MGRARAGEDPLGPGVGSGRRPPGLGLAGGGICAGGAAGRVYCCGAGPGG